MVRPLLYNCWTYSDNLCLIVLKSCTDFEEGEVLLLQKPLYWTSFDLVNKVKMAVRHHCGLKKLKVGHAGTLDPLATGLMIVCTGKATRRVEEFRALREAGDAQEQARALLVDAVAVLQAWPRPDGNRSSSAGCLKYSCSFSLRRSWACSAP